MKALVIMPSKQSTDECGSANKISRLPRLTRRASLPGVFALCAVVFTVLIYLGEVFGISHPAKGNLELVLGTAELFGWLVVFGDNATRLQLYTAGLPFAVLFNGVVLWLLGYALKRIVF